MSPRAIREARKGARRRVCRHTRGRDLVRQFAERIDQSTVARQPDDTVDVMGLTPRQQVVAAEAGVGADGDPDVGPDRAELRHETIHLVRSAHTRVDAPAT
jgi:hypothetical protein